MKRPTTVVMLVYDAVCSAVPGAAIPGGAEGLPADSTMTIAEVAFAANQCTGILLPAAFRTATQQERLAKILDVTGLPENFLLNDMIFATLGMSDLVHGRTKLNRKIGTGNVSVDYDDAEINSSIARVSPACWGRAQAGG